MEIKKREGFIIIDEAANVNMEEIRKALDGFDLGRDEDPSTMEDVEKALRLINPKELHNMKARLHMCAANGCTNRGEWHPVLVLRPKAPAKGYRRDSAPAGRAKLEDVYVCDKHKAQYTKASAYLTDASWQQIVNVHAAQRLRKPHRSSTLVEYERAE
jgi:hypothetical protein